ncbi:MAG TPA: hypothetical protein EYQ12_00900 [Oceanospirillaceae bacterium]|nr:hypothetical protein [Oceanospirillaceae bacterium]
MIDQIQPSLLKEGFQDIFDKVATYANLMGPLLDVPGDVAMDKAIKAMPEALSGYWQKAMNDLHTN